MRISLIRIDAADHIFTIDDQWDECLIKSSSIAFKQSIIQFDLYQQQQSLMPNDFSLIHDEFSIWYDQIKLIILGMRANFKLLNR